jgi:hypothetical protein
VPAELAPFYESVLGWKSEPVGTGARDSVVFLRGGNPVASVSHRSREGAKAGVWRSRWTGFFGVEDLDVAEIALATAGGQVMQTAHAGAVRGTRQLLAVDTEGAVFGLLAMEDGAKPGEARKGFWPVLLVRQTVEATTFYRGVFGGEVRGEARTPLFGGDFLLMQGERAWAGVQPQGMGGRPGWLLLIAVADIETATAAARKAGGRVLRAPLLDLIGGRVAVLADPTGGVFGLYEAMPLGDTLREGTNGGTGAGAFEVEALSQ